MGFTKSNFLLTIVVLIAISLNAQDFETISKKDIIKVSGGVGVQATSYTAIGIKAKRDPFLWQTNINLNFNILGVVSAPFSATFSSQNAELSTPQPFNNFGISPKYKAVTAHLGYRSMNLSEFSLSGSQFFGIGVEVAPKNAYVKGKALYGRFAKPVFFNPDGTVATTPSFARHGWGAGLTFGRSAKSEVSVNIFKAKDDPNSLNIPQEDLIISPAENLVFGITGKQDITKQISFQGEVDFSFYTNDLNVGEEQINGFSYLNNIFLFNYNPTSEVKKAISTSINYKPKFAKFNLKYRRVDPEYKTLGTSFINNDYEDISLKSSFGLLKKKLVVSVSGGFQRNNLNEDKVSRLHRVIYATNLSYNVNDKWNTSLNYSNFNSSTRQTVIVDFDSLRFVQTTKAAGATATRSATNNNITNSLSFGVNYQDAIVNNKKTTSFYNGNIGYQRQYSKMKLTLGSALLLLYNETEINTTANIGPSVNVSKTLLKDKLQLSLMSAYLNSYIDGTSTGEIINLALSGSYAIFKKHNIGFNATDIIRDSDATGKQSEITATVNYRFTF